MNIQNRTEAIRMTCAKTLTRHSTMEGTSFSRVDRVASEFKECIKEARTMQLAREKEIN